MRSFRFGASPNASFTAADFRDLDNWTTNVGTIRFGVNTKKEIKESKGSASKAIASTKSEKQEIISEGSELRDRFKKLAGITKFNS